MLKPVALAALALILIPWLENDAGSADGFMRSDSLEADSVVYLRKSIEFLYAVMPSELSDTSFVLVDTPPVYQFNRCLEQLAGDSTALDKEDLEYLKRKAYPKISRWKDEHFPEIKIIGRYTLNRIFKLGPQAGWAFFNKHVGSEYYTFAYPLFLKNYTYCLFYSEYRCAGIFCASGELTLYKLENGRWVYARSYCSWSA